MRTYFLYVSMTLSFVLNPLLVGAQTEITDEMFTEEAGQIALVLDNIDRFLYVISLDGAEATRVEGYARALNDSWLRLAQKESRTIILDDISPGRHTITIEAFQDANSAKAQLREEFLYDYDPLIFDLDVSASFITKHAIDLQKAMPSRVAAFHTVEYGEESAQIFTDDLEGRHIEINVRQFRTKDKIGRATRRLNARGKWDRAEKYIYRADMDVTMDGKSLLSEKDVPYSGRVEYRYWDYTYGKWWDEAFLDNNIRDKVRITQVARTIPLMDGYELRIAAYDRTVTCTIVRTDGAVVMLSSAYDE